MTDQISPTGGLAVGLPATTLAASAVGPAFGNNRSGKIADSPSQDQTIPALPGSSDSIGKAVEKINGHLEQASTQLRIQVDSATGKTVYRFVDPTSGQVVFQVPSEEVLAMAQQLQSMDKQAGAPGVLLDKSS
jgi:uncharacterized FlaG/YvyC family protein